MLFQAILITIAMILHDALLIIVGLALVVPYLSVAVRRMHDTGRSGAWIAWLLVAPQALQLLALLMVVSNPFGPGLALAALSIMLVFAGGLVAIVLLALPGTPGRNRYGPSPAHARPTTL